MRFPGLRFTVSRMMVAVAVVAVAVLMLPILLTEKVWSGHASIPLEFLVLDASTGQALEGASVRLVEGDPEYQATTGPDGRAKLVVEASVGGHDSLFRRTRSVNYAWALIINCDDHRAVSKDLREFTRDARYHLESAPPPIAIRLEQSP